MQSGPPTLLRRTCAAVAQGNANPEQWQERAAWLVFTGQYLEDGDEGREEDAEEPHGHAAAGPEAWRRFREAGLPGCTHRSASRPQACPVGSGRGTAPPSALPEPAALGDPAPEPDQAGQRGGALAVTEAEQDGPSQVRKFIKESEAG